jgi:hypothetical protein
MMACNMLIFTKKSEQVLTLEMTSPKSSGFNYVTNQQPHHHECENIIKFNSVLCNWLSNSQLETASLQCTSWVILKGMYLLEFFTGSLSIWYDPQTTNPKNWMTQFLLLEFKQECYLLTDVNLYQNAHAYMGCSESSEP